MSDAEDTVAFRVRDLTSCHDFSSQAPFVRSDAKNFSDHLILMEASPLAEKSLLRQSKKVFSPLEM